MLIVILSAGDTIDKNRALPSWSQDVCVRTKVSIAVPSSRYEETQKGQSGCHCSQRSQGRPIELVTCGQKPVSENEKNEPYK